MPNATTAPRTTPSASGSCSASAATGATVVRATPCLAGPEHGLCEVGAHHDPGEPRLAGQLGRDVQRARAQIEIEAVRVALPAELPDRAPTPRAIDVHAEEMIEEIVPRRDLGEDPPHVPLLLRPSRRRRIRELRLRCQWHAHVESHRVGRTEARGPLAGLTC